MESQVLSHLVMAVAVAWISEAFMMTLCKGTPSPPGTAGPAAMEAALLICQQQLLPNTVQYPSHYVCSPCVVWNCDGEECAVTRTG
jgi:hypothetical protein